MNIIKIEIFSSEDKEKIQKTKNKKMSAEKPPISTHILDTTRGQPAAGVDVSISICFVRYVRANLIDRCHKNKIKIPAYENHCN